MSRTEATGGAFKKILVAVDGSENSIKATKTAASIAATERSEMTVLHVIVLPKDLWGDKVMGSVLPNDFWKRLREQADQIVSRAAAVAREQGVEARKEVKEDAASVVQAITDFADKSDVDLIVMGTRGLGGFKKLLIGSVSTGVTNHADCAVLVVR